MSALPVAPSQPRHIDIHAIRQYCKRVDERMHPDRNRGGIRCALFYMWRVSRPATVGQLMLLHVRIDETCEYRFSDSHLGLFLLIIKSGTLTTLYKVCER